MENKEMLQQKLQLSANCFRLFQLFLTFYRLFPDHLGSIRGSSGGHPGSFVLLRSNIFRLFCDFFPIVFRLFPDFFPTIWGSSGDSPGRSPGWAGQDGQGQEGGAGGRGGGVLTEVRAPALKTRSHAFTERRDEGNAARRFGRHKRGGGHG